MPELSEFLAALGIAGLLALCGLGVVIVHNRITRPPPPQLPKARVAKRPHATT
jgi:hypothetical protein